DRTQADIRSTYDTRLAKAREMLRDRELLGLSNSQVGAYIGVYALLLDEKRVSLGLTEDEKRAAKFGFKSTFNRELQSAVVRVPQLRPVFSAWNGTIGEVQSSLRTLRTAVETGNPVGAVLTELNDKLAKADEFARYAAALSRGAGERIASATAGIRDLVAPLNEVLGDALGAIDEAGGAVVELQEQVDDFTEAERTPRTSLDVPLPDSGLVGQILAATGGPPAIDGLAAVIANQALRRVPPDERGDPAAELSSMRDRVNARVRGNTRERINDICNRLTGALHRATQQALANGQPAPSTATPCTYWKDDDLLQAVVEARRAAREAEASATTTTVAPTTTARPATELPSTTAGATTTPAPVYDGTYTADAINRPLGDSVVDLNNMAVEFTVLGTEVTGTARHTIVSTFTPESGAYTVENTGTLVADLTATVDELGNVSGSGIQTVTYAPSVCLGGDCDRVQTPLGSDAEVMFTGTIEGDTFVGEIGNPSGFIYSFEATI
ncbi:MAG: hypothetical protein AAFY28_22275, partial [Actinomycetota bacterium]